MQKHLNVAHTQVTKIRTCSDHCFGHNKFSFTKNILFIVSLVITATVCILKKTFLCMHEPDIHTCYEIICGILGIQYHVFVQVVFVIIRINVMFRKFINSFHCDIEINMEGFTNKRIIFQYLNDSYLFTYQISTTVTREYLLFLPCVSDRNIFPNNINSSVQVVSLTFYFLYLEIT